MLTVDYDVEFEVNKMWKILVRDFSFSTVVQHEFSYFFVHFSISSEGFSCKKILILNMLFEICRSCP